MHNTGQLGLRHPSNLYQVGNAPHMLDIVCEGIQSKRLYHSSWSSPEKFADYLVETITKPGFQSWYGRRDPAWIDCDFNFTGVRTFQEAIDLARAGWKEGGEIVAKTRGYIKAMNPMTPRPVKYSIHGAIPNVPRAVAGNILNMREPKNTKSGKRPIITICYNMCEPWYIKREAITNKAAVMAALIDEIEAKGFACEVVAVAGTEDWSIRTEKDLQCITSVIAKNSDQPVDINRLSFCLGHSALFRCLMFADWQCHEFVKDIGRGLGHAGTTEPNADANFKHIYTIVSGSSNHFETIEKAATEGVKCLISELVKQGCPAFEKKDHEDGSNEKTKEVTRKEDDS